MFGPSDAVGQTRATVAATASLAVIYAGWIGLRKTLASRFMRVHSMSLRVLIFAYAASMIAGQTATSGSVASYTGTLGQNRISLSLTIQNGVTITSGHYFYSKYLKNISLTGEMRDGGLVLREPEGGAFQLRFKGNGSEGGKPLDFENSVGLEGTWSKDGKSLPVHLHMEGVSASKDGRYYQWVTDESDEAFEARVQGFCRAVLGGDKAGAARYVEFPLRVNQAGKSRHIRSAAQLASNWNRIFTPATLHAMQDAMPHELFVHDGQAMLGSGVVWFGAKGAKSVNVF